MPTSSGQTRESPTVLSETTPALERLAEDDADDIRREPWCLGRDDSTPSVPDEAGGVDPNSDRLRSPLPQRDYQLPEDLVAILEPPLADHELAVVAHDIADTFRPAKCYFRERRKEMLRLANRYPHKTMIIGKGLPSARRGVIEHHYIKRRWEKLGIWNPKWGIPGPNPPADDPVWDWRWPWEPEDTDLDRRAKGEDLARRVMQSRRGLRREEAALVAPCSRLPPNAPASTAETFMMTRPWFIYEVEHKENEVRNKRLVWDQWLLLYQQYPSPFFNEVEVWWKERGDKRGEPDWLAGVAIEPWKWRHESPSPEPEDLTPINQMKNSPLDAAEEMEFTPSEVDALEAIPSDTDALEATPSDNVVPSRPHLFGSVEPRDAPGDGPPGGADGGAPEPQQHASRTPPADTPAQTQHQPRPQAQSQPQTAGGDASQTQPPPPPRRSSRIAAIKRKRATEDDSSEPAPNNKKRKGGGRAAPRAAAASTARPAARKSRQPKAAGAAGQPKRGRGRPRKN